MPVSPSISIVTLSQYSRLEFLKITAKCIAQQTISKDCIKEWIILDTSHVAYQPNEQDLRNKVDDLRRDSTLPVIVYALATKSSIGGWRNEAADLVSGDIVICFDDDDYYYPTMISECVRALADKKYLIAGCDRMLMYDCFFAKCYVFEGFNKFVGNHSTNNCMAYWREYLNNHRYDESVSHAEEVSFTNDFSEPMAQLVSDKTVLQMSHGGNTYDKKRIIYINNALPDSLKYVFEIPGKLDDLIPDSEIVNRYNEIFQKMTITGKSPYDIVYLCGFSPSWNLNDPCLGAAQRAVKCLAREWALNGKKVGVYGSFEWNGCFENMDYHEFHKFRFWDIHQTLIVWGMVGFNTYMKLGLKAECIIMDTHEMFYVPESGILNRLDRINHWIFKSHYQKRAIETAFKIPIENSTVISSGVDSQVAEVANEYTGITNKYTGISTNKYTRISEIRNPYRLCYCSSNNRGLERILGEIWPRIFRLEPRAELHVYSHERLETRDGVMSHGRQSREIILRENLMSTFHLYYTDSPDEIDASELRESLAVGCIPLMAEVNVFRERSGIHIEWLPNLPVFNDKIANVIVNLMHNLKWQTELREAYMQQTPVNWHETAEKWLKVMF